MTDDILMRKELNRLYKVKKCLLFIAFPIFLVAAINLYSCLFNTSNFSYIRVLLLLSLCIAMIVIWGQAYFYTLKDEERIKKEINN